jgi:hypothetical protein
MALIREVLTFMNSSGNLQVLLQFCCLHAMGDISAAPPVSLQDAPRYRLDRVCKTCNALLQSYLRRTSLPLWPKFQHLKAVQLPQKQLIRLRIHLSTPSSIVCAQCCKQPLFIEIRHDLSGNIACCLKSSGLCLRGAEWQRSRNVLSSSLLIEHSLSVFG